MKPLRENIKIYMSLVARLSINNVQIFGNGNVAVYLSFVLAFYTAELSEMEGMSSVNLGSAL